MILVTGATGFLGMTLIARLLEDQDGPDIVLPVRARDREGARERLDTMLATLYDDVPTSAERLRPLPADILEPSLGLAAPDVRDVQRVVHCAASISFTLPIGQAREINVGGTANVIDLCHRLPSLDRYVHVSTAYVAGRATGTFREDDLDVGQAFRNTYEQTKWEAERLVRASDLPTVVVRPSIVVGESASGWTSAFNVIYWPLQAFARGLLNEVAADPQGIVDIVPVDRVIDVLAAAMTEPGAAGTYHAVAGDHALRVAQLAHEACDILDRPVPTLVTPGAADPADPAAVFAPYFAVAVSFDDSRARELVGETRVADIESVLGYALFTRWGKRPITRQAAHERLAVDR